MGLKMDLETEIGRIMDDRVHGASWLSREALGILKSLAESLPSGNAEQLLGAMRKAAIRLAEARPSMASITNMVARLLYEVEGERGMPLPRFRKLTSEMASSLSEASRRWMALTANNTAELIEGKEAVITYSYSSTVLEALSRRPEVRTIVPESRPLFEGRRMAEKLVERGGQTTLIIDGAMAYFAREADAALVGADSVLADGSIVNKVGTRLTALAAEDGGVPFYVACETCKFDVRNYLGRPPILEEGCAAEVAEGFPGVEVRNPCFEVTPARLITSLVTEKGVMDVEAIRTQMKEMSMYVRPLLEALP